MSVGPITLRNEGGRTYLDGDWPDETEITAFFLEGILTGITREGDTLVFTFANADAVYRIGALDPERKVYALTKIRASRRVA